MDKILRADIGLSLSFTTFSSAWDQKMFSNFAELNLISSSLRRWSWGKDDDSKPLNVCCAIGDVSSVYTLTYLSNNSIR